MCPPCPVKGERKNDQAFALQFNKFLRAHRHQRGAFEACLENATPKMTDKSWWRLFLSPE